MPPPCRIAPSILSADFAALADAIDRHTPLTLDCHLMMTNPGDFLEAFQAAGADWITVHVEVDDTAELLAAMARLGVKAGLAVNPETPVEAVEPWLGSLDHVLVMTVHPGFGGQSFIAEVVPKIRALSAAIAEGGHRAFVEVDGGVDAETIAVVAEAGATCFVAGNAVFGQPDPAEAVRRLRAAADAACEGRR